MDKIGHDKAFAIEFGKAVELQGQRKNFRTMTFQPSRVSSINNTGVRVETRYGLLPIPQFTDQFKGDPTTAPGTVILAGVLVTNGQRLTGVLVELHDLPEKLQKHQVIFFSDSATQVVEIVMDFDDQVRERQAAEVFQFCNNEVQKQYPTVIQGGLPGCRAHLRGFEGQHC